MVETNSNYGKKLISWEFPEFNHHNRTKSWYIVAGLVTLLMIIYAVATGNMLFAIVIVMIVLVLIVLQRNAKELTFSIFEDGIVMGEQFFSFKDIDKFYIIYDPPEIKSLFFEFKSIIHPRAPINLMNQNPVKVRQILLQYLEEDLERENEPISDQIGRMMKL